MTPPYDYDFLVLGGGSAGYAAARTAREHVERVAIIDGASELGGLCILRGCMPSKTLIYSAEVLHLAQAGKTFGLDIPQAQVNMPALHQRKKEIIAEFAEYRQEQLHSDRFTLIPQHGRFIDPHTIALSDGSTIRAEKIIITTGSKIAEPNIPGLASTPFLTSDDILDLDSLPPSMVVLGGGIVACELAQLLCRMGCQVTQIQRSPYLVKEASPQAASVLAQALRDNGITLYTDTQITQISGTPDGVAVQFNHQGESITAEATHLFNALGRTPNTHSLDLAKAQVHCLPSGHIETNTHQQSSTPHIYAAGDCSGPHEIVHVAILQGENAAQHACGQTTEAIHYDHLLGVIFTDPQIASVGLSEKQLQERGIAYLSADYPFDDHGKSILMNALYGYVKIFAEAASGKILGAECVGKDAGELIHAMTVPVSMGASVQQMLKAHWYHPTLSEIWTYPLEDIADAVASNDSTTADR